MSTDTDIPATDAQSGPETSPAEARFEILAKSILHDRARLDVMIEQVNRMAETYNANFETLRAEIVALKDQVKALTPAS